MKYVVMLLILAGFVGMAHASQNETTHSTMMPFEEHYEIEILGLEDEYSTDDEYSFYFVISGYGYGCAGYQASYPDENGLLIGMGAEPLCDPETSMREFKIKSPDRHGTLVSTVIKKPGTYAVTVTFEKPSKYFPTTVSKEFLVAEPADEKPNEMTPLKQFKSGVPVNEIQCRELYVRVFKNSDDSPACVTLESKSKLMEREWADETLVQQISKNKIISSGTGFVLPEDNFTKEDLKQLEQREKNLRKIRDNPDTAYEQRQSVSGEIRQMQDRLQYPFQTGVPYHLVKEIKERYAVLEINLDDAKKHVRFSVLNSDSISSEHHALRVGIHPQSFGLSELEFSDKKIREYLGNEMNILYEAVSVIPN